MSEDVRHDDTPNLLEFIELRPRRTVDSDTGYNLFEVWGMPMGCHDRKSMVRISRSADALRLQHHGLPEVVPGLVDRESTGDSKTVNDFRLDILNGRIHLFFRYHYLTAEGLSTVTLDRSDVKKER